MEKVKAMLAKIVVFIKFFKELVVSKLSVIVPTIKSLTNSVVSFVSTPTGKKILIALALVILLSVGYCVVKSHNGDKPSVQIHSVEVEVKANNDSSILDSVTKKLGF